MKFSPLVRARKVEWCVVCARKRWIEISNWTPPLRLRRQNHQSRHRQGPKQRPGPCAPGDEPAEATQSTDTGLFSARRPQRTCGEKVRRRISGCAVAVAVKTGPEALQDRRHVHIVSIAGTAGRRTARLFHEAPWLASMPCRFSLRKHFGRLRGDDAIPIRLHPTSPGP